MTVSLVYTWRCLTCAEHGEGPTSNTQAEKHGKATGHATITSGTPKGKP